MTRIFVISKSFTPNYQHILDAIHNRKPQRLPLYEHIISHEIMEQALGIKFAEMGQGNDVDLNEYFKHYCRFFREMTYDTISFEICITPFLPDHGAIMGGRPGPIQNRQDFEKFPWDEIPGIFWESADKQLKYLLQNIPSGMQVIGGIGNGVFEISEDLMGFEYLCVTQMEDPDLFTDLFKRIGELVLNIWEKFLKVYAEHFVVCRFGDDLGYKGSTLLSPQVIRTHILPEYKNVINLIHNYHKPFLLHSCGNIFEVMDDLIAIGIDGKHSNEDIIAPFDTWVERYGQRIALFGGIDVDVLCQKKPGEVFDQVIDSGRRFRHKMDGYALGSGNSIPDFVPLEGYLAMIKAVQALREEEKMM